MYKIAIVGPESTGKSTISPKLAAYYQTIWVPEYARTYCEKLTSPCTWEDEINMFKGQLALEQSLISEAKNNIIFCDTTFITIKIWSDKMFGKCPPEVIEALPKHHYDFYLLMNIDLPWEDDPLRDFPNEREYFMNVWHQELQSLNANYVVISGSHEDRFKSSVAAIDQFLATASPKI